MFKFLKKDSMLVGFLLGAAVPPIIFTILYFTNMGVSKAFDKSHILEDNTVKLISIVLNIFIFRHYLVKEHFEKSGRGVLLATFIYALVIFYFFIRHY